MKKLLLTGAMLFVLTIAKGQATNPDTTKLTRDTSIHSVYTSIYQQATFPGGNNRIFSYIRKNLRYPEEAREKGVEGIVMVSFLVGKDGHLQDIKIEKGVSPELDAEALRLIKGSPVWMPAVQNGRAVAQSFKVPVTFKLN